ncbi:MAG TPA: amidohydrolase family protein [Steroidobacteraceae bacterium]|nr:amidohydrolase family protein [Steroidobacteraceae bacterium]
MINLSFSNLWARAPHAALFIACTAVAVAAAREDQVRLQGNLAGSQTITSSEPGSAQAEFSFNDRGRGDHIVAHWKLDAAGVPLEYSGSGNDYMKAAVAESFRLVAGKASWHSRAEQGERAVSGEAFYVPAFAPPEFLGVLARALLQAPSHKLPLLPAGEAQIAPAGSVPLHLAGVAATELREYEITGLDFSPTSVWLDPEGNTAAVISGWFSTAASMYAPVVAELSKAQAATASEWSAAIARRLTHVPDVDLVIRNARLYDPRDMTVTGGTSVVIKGERIVRVGPDTEVRPAAGAQIIDAAGRFLMPGLWDNHQHFSDNDGALDLANGVTSARDMANDTDEFLRRVARFDAGSELGPHVFKAGMIDGKGPLAGPTKMLVDSPAEALRDVDWYADHGYGQIKIYSSVKPALVPIIADEAHARGLRVSGHVPAFMSAQQFVSAGADEIQHLNFIVLNFLLDSVPDTRGMTRFSAVAEHATELGPENPRVRNFISWLHAHHTVLDPTMNVFEALFCGDPAAVVPGLEQVVRRFPPQVRRGLMSNALVVPKGKEAQYRQAFPEMQRLLKALHDAGVTIIPGTDALAGYTLHHELALYARAGIPPREVLRMATLTSAQVIGVDGQRGVIAPGRVADMILVKGDPAERIADLDSIDIVIKSGHVFDPSKIEQALGITARQ